MLAAGLEHQQARRFGEAEQLYRQILELDARHANALHLLGMVGFQTGRHDMAAQLIQRAIASDGRDSSHHANLGNVLQMQGKFEEAVTCYKRALKLNPRSAVAYGNLGEALKSLGKLEAAAASFGRALALEPEMALAHSNLGNVRQAQGQMEEASACYERALALEPELAMAHANLGSLRQAQGKLDEALACYERAMELDPALDISRFNWSTVRLLQGDYATGLPEYEARWRLNRPRNFAHPQWRGEPLNGARILLHAEQGLGDTLQMLRYLTMVQAAGGDVILEVQPPLLRLAAQLPGIGHGNLIAAGEPLPDFAWHCPLMSLPLAFATTPESIPARAPYLVVPQEAAEKARGFPWPSTGLRVGLAWAGSPTHLRDRFRSIPLAMLEPLFGLQGAKFFSLQVGEAAAQLAAAGLSVIDLRREIEDMADTAALIGQLNLVITADTSVAHLAGALGKPVWVMLPFAPDWRWLLDRKDSPWYPTMRLFRQTRLEDWASVIERVREALTEKIAGDRKAEMEDEAAVAGRARESNPSRGAISSVAHSGSSECKVCQGASQLFGVVDFHKSCMEAKGLRLSLSGVPVYYRRCGQCGFTFTEAFDGWPAEEFQNRIYNNDYILVDPDFVEVRPAVNARMVAESFPDSRESIRILDYGGGSGLLAERLREMGFSAATYDPFSQFHEVPHERFDLITCFEVMEHVPQPRETVAAMVSLLNEDGAILFSTLVQPAEFEKIGLSWWYAAPRNGHVSLYTQAALAHLFKAHGMKVGSFSAALHIVYRRAPAFAAHLNLPE
jgi:tetratricopeptide (TPR) repeat protein/SAM-dependent methyltransferase